MTEDTYLTGCPAESTPAAVVEGTCLPGCFAVSETAAVVEDTCLTVATAVVAKMLSVAADVPCEGTKAPDTSPD